MSSVPGIRIESVSLGKGYVSYRVHFPPLSRRNRAVQKEYPRLARACEAIKRHCRREDCEPETIALVERHVPDGEWSS